MRLNRFFTERTNLTLNSSVKLEDSDIRHIRNVLRLKKGDEIILFNGEKEYLAELTIVGREFVTAKIRKILKVEDFSPEAGVEITLFQSLLRSNNFDLVVEKATELGVEAIVPIENEFSQVKVDVAERRMERWNKIVIAALKQSQRIKVPEIYQPMTFQDSLELRDKFDLVFLFTIPRDNIDESKNTVDLKTFINKNVEEYANNSTTEDNKVSKPQKVAFYIGPEGGFSPNEHKLGKAANLTFVSFGTTILRCETAAISLLAILKYIFS